VVILGLGVGVVDPEALPPFEEDGVVGDVPPVVVVVVEDEPVDPGDPVLPLPLGGVVVVVVVVVVV
jgi:hypothetical protein